MGVLLQLLGDLLVVLLVLDLDWALCKSKVLQGTREKMVSIYWICLNIYYVKWRSALYFGEINFQSQSWPHSLLSSLRCPPQLALTLNSGLCGIIKMVRWPTNSILGH